MCIVYHTDPTDAVKCQCTTRFRLVGAWRSSREDVFRYEISLDEVYLGVGNLASTQSVSAQWIRISDVWAN